MENNKKLELTLCGMLPYGLDIRIETNPCKGEIHKLSAVYKHGVTCLGKRGKFGFVERVTTDIKPLLHSLDKLTEPILEGGIIPIVELFKMRTQKLIGDINAVYQGENQIAVLRLNPIKIADANIWHQHFFEIDYDNENICFSLATEIHNFDELEESFGFIGNEFKMLEKLKEWHFNIYDLPKEMYIEKSEINGN